MKKIYLSYLFVALFSSTMFTSCNNDDEHIPSNVTRAVLDAFEMDYPSVNRVDWDYEHGYSIAEFHQNNTELHVWYNRDADWCMTETELGHTLANVPHGIQDAFLKSNYDMWNVDEITRYERPADEFYLIEVERKGEKDRKLFYSPTGMLLKDAVDTANDDVLPNITF